MKQFDEITIFSDDIKSTETFKSLSFIRQKMILNRTSRIAIQQSVNVCATIGLEHWLKRTSARPEHQQIVEEIIKSYYQKIREELDHVSKERHRLVFSLTQTSKSEKIQKIEEQIWDCDNKIEKLESLL